MKLTLSEMRKNFWEGPYKDWNYYIEEINQQEDLNEEIRKKVLKGLKQIRRAFGRSWIESAFEPPVRHHLSGYLMNMAPWSRLWVADLGLKIKYFEKYSNFKNLLGRLKNPYEFNSAKTELDIAYIIKKRRKLNLEFIEDKTKRSADLKVMIGDEQTYIEITSLTTAEESLKATKNFNELSYPFMFDKDVVVRFRLHKILSDPAVKELKRKIKKTVEQVRKIKKCKEISEENVINCFVYPKENTEGLEEWNKRNGEFGGFVGPPTNVDEIGRLRNKIKQKVKKGQLPKNEPGLLVIDVRNLLFFLDKVEDYWDLANKIDQTIFEHPNLSAGVVIGPFHSIVGIEYPSKQKIYKKGEYVLIPREEFEWRNAVLIVRNRYSKFKEPINSLIKLFK
ncbi:hypothetical protein KY343_02660 [Candidatus Woesearchaeota archaeon]|nr:hypothetical protein [Candidatus Woesearchaeota archaeon]